MVESNNRWSKQVLEAKMVSERMRYKMNEMVRKIKELDNYITEEIETKEMQERNELEKAYDSVRSL